MTLPKLQAQVFFPCSLSNHRRPGRHPIIVAFAWHHPQSPRHFPRLDIRRLRLVGLLRLLVRVLVLGLLALLQLVMRVRRLRVLYLLRGYRILLVLLRRRRRLLPPHDLRVEPPGEVLDVHLRRDGGAVRRGGPVTVVRPAGVGPRGQQRPRHEQVPVGAGEVQRRVPVGVAPGHRLPRPAGHVRQQNLQRRVVAAAAGRHDGVPAPAVPPQHHGRVPLAQQVHRLGVPALGRQHQRRAVVLVERRRGLLVPEAQQQPAHLPVAQRRRQVQAAVRAALGRRVGVVQQVGVVLEDAPHEEDVRGPDGPAQAERGLDPCRRGRVRHLGEVGGGDECVDVHVGQTRLTPRTVPGEDVSMPVG